MEIIECENRVPKQNQLDVLENYGEAQTVIVKKLFEGRIDVIRLIELPSLAGDIFFKSKFFQNY